MQQFSGMMNRRPITSNTGLRIGIVDDRPEIRDLIKLILLGNGRQFFQSGTVAQARQLAADFKPELVLLDAMLPGGECGFSFCDELKHATNAPLVIMMSARREEAVLDRAREANADGFITKPFSPATLRGIVEDIEESRGSRLQSSLEFWPES